MENSFSSTKILGVRVDLVDIQQATELILGWLTKRDQAKYSVVTPNVEFIIAADKDQKFKKILNEADLAIPDSARLGWADYELYSKSWLDRVLAWPLFLMPKLLPKKKNYLSLGRFPVTTGVDLMENLCRHLNDQSLSIGLLGGRDGVAEKTAECLQKKYPGLKITFALAGPEIDSNGQVRGPAAPASRRPSSLTLWSRRREDSCASPLTLPNTDLLFVAFGQVKQEKWIANNLENLPVKVAIGVGGAFDYLSGQVPRAPAWMRKLGLEWLFRLIIQPWRIKRQLSLIKFVWQITRS
jgi:N-acetylglucosaminyldiphosphoundecaprenol N-acetyl-beta-D-mannosaminyltransferase